jgi:hypothetical protein
MGTQFTNTLSGNTNGTIITVDYSQDFINLNANLVDLYTALGTLDTTLKATNTALGTLNTSVNASIGVAGATTPGAVSNSALLSKDVLTVIAESLLSIEENQNELTQSLGQMTFAVSGIASGTQESIAVQQLALADQLSTNEFQKTATKEALARNGIDPPAPRPISTIIQEKVQEATTINVTASATAFVSEKVTSGVSYASTTAVSYVGETAVGGWFAARWADVKKVFVTEKAPDKVYKQNVSTQMAQIRTGVKGAIPPPPTTP